MVRFSKRKVSGGDIVTLTVKNLPRNLLDIPGSETDD
jgi:hypothetical protein